MTTSLITEKTHLHKNQATIVSKKRKVKWNLVLKTKTKERRKIATGFIHHFPLILKRISPERFFKVFRKLGGWRMNALEDKLVNVVARTKYF